jgi:hypothetical protein
MQHWLEPITLAYLDPGMGSYALQLLMAGLFGGMFALRQSWGELRVWASSRLGANRVVHGPSPGPGRIGARPSEVAEVSRHAGTSTRAR